MSQCPECKKWSLEFDDYFGRYRCFNPECEWMPMSSAEREIRLLKNHQRPEIIDECKIPELGLAVKVTYDKLNDVLAFNFVSASESTFDLPESDGRIVWKVAHRSGSVVGFAILEAQNFGVSQVKVNIKARKEVIEQNLKRIPLSFLSGHPTRMLITSVEITTELEEDQIPSEAFQAAIKKFESTFCQT